MPIFCPKQSGVDEGCPYKDKDSLKLNVLMREHVLHTAVGKGDVALTAKLLQRGHNVNCTNGQGETPLHQAIDQQNLTLVRLLLKHGADATLMPHYGVSSLYQAVETGNLALVHILLNSHDCSQELKLPDQHNPLMLAVVRENVAITQLLLQQGARIDITNERGETPLVLAAMGTDHDRQFQLGILLLKHGADPKQKDSHGHMPAHYSWHNAFTAYIGEYRDNRPLSLLSLARRTILYQLVVGGQQAQTHAMEERVRQLPVPATLKDCLLFSQK